MASHTSNFENYRISDLERIYQGIQHKKEALQFKMAEDIGEPIAMNLRPGNFKNIPELEKCSLHDISMLTELCEKEFKVFWLKERKKAEQNHTLEKYYATYALYYYMNKVSDSEFMEFMNRAEKYVGEFITTHGVIYKLMDNPRFIEEVNSL